MLRPSDRVASKSGTSRYSKALPGVPGSDDYDDADDDADDTSDSKSGAGRISGAKDSDPAHSRSNSAFSLPARTSSLASPPPPAKDLPLPPLPTKLQLNLGDSNGNSKSYKSSANSPVDNIRQVTVAAPSPVSSIATSAPSLQSPPLSARSHMMAIPRKPIANLKPPSAQFLDQPSPTFSMSSILMAYMDDDDESQAESQGMSQDGADEKQRDVAAGSNQHYAASSSSNRTGAASERPTAASAPSVVSARGSSGSLPARPNAGKDRNTRPADGNTAPPPPLKDRTATPLQKPSAATLTASPTSAPAPALAASLAKPLPPTDSSELAAPSSPRPEIWKRRPHMTQGSSEVSGLRLDSSNGSTADTQPSWDASTAPETVSTDKAAAQRATPFAGGLPGRNIRPSLPLKDGPIVSAEAMGAETSKMKHIKDKLAPQRSDSVPSNTAGAKAGPASALVAKRPPTPEYQKEEVKEPAVEPFISPVSPASSPEAPRGASPDFTMKGLPPKPSNGGQPVTLPSGPKPIARKALPSQPSQDLTAAKNAFRQQPNANSAGASSSQASAVSVPPKVEAVPAAAPAAPTAPAAAPTPAAPLKDAASIRLVSSRDAPSVQAQPAKERADAPQAVNPQRSMPQVTSDSRVPQPDAQGTAYRGRDGTVYAEMKTGGEPNPKAAYFPKQSIPGLMKDGVAKARPLRDAHFNCFQKHRSMARRSNRNCPLTCQTCDRADVQDRWVCAFCHLRICDSCHRRLDGYQRDLRRFVDALAGPSSSRPGTSSGI
ncbi:hypothetical protein M440DRAFT_1327028 [Trichoderma longibrachiatum ATCC 18648]|uniref:Uncharacterized protein n=1 Tax=Trichoderma longibrachiatum ATCC 18648 TaxID=983965 RepID=A0A2T4CCN3_TRILO|nr:hypothetical protein M440DRAFT_1327028 [Trichoderma longibrachiatum ATCC 18648]